MATDSHSDPAEPAPRDGIVTRLGNAVCRVCLVIAALSMLAIVAINAANVIGRYLFGSPFSWAEESMLFLMVLIIFTGTPVAAWRNQHIRIEAFIDHAGAATRRALVAISALVSIVVILLVSNAGYHIVAMLKAFDQRSDALHFPVWIPQGFLTGGLALTALMIAAAWLSGRLR